VQDIKGDRLYVNLSANQTRRRLAGHGFGVRKVYSNGKNQAHHRDEFHGLFEDVIASGKR
jgi:hypothetical protein